MLRNAWKEINCNITSNYLWELESLLIFITVFYLSSVILNFLHCVAFQEKEKFHTYMLHTACHSRHGGNHVLNSFQLSDVRFWCSLYLTAKGLQPNHFLLPTLQPFSTSCPLTRVHAFGAVPVTGSVIRPLASTQQWSRYICNITKVHKSNLIIFVKSKCGSCAIPRSTPHL